MEKNYKVTQMFADKLIEWRDQKNIDSKSGAAYVFVDGLDIQNVPDIVDIWWTEPDNAIERNNRLITIIQWLNGEDVFEVVEPKYIVRSDKCDHDGDYTYILVENGMTTTAYILDYATRFDTQEKAQEWANSHQVVVGIDEDGNEVE